AYFIYRAATGGVQRDMYLLASTNQGKSFEGIKVHPWMITSCPMSSESFAEGPKGDVYTAWETDGQVYFARIKPGQAEIDTPIAAPGAGKGRKHPALAVNGKGQIILVWTEGTGWQRGGALAWQVFAAAGKALPERGRVANGIPVWGLPTVIAEADGRF